MNKLQKFIILSIILIGQGYGAVSNYTVSGYAVLERINSDSLIAKGMDTITNINLPGVKIIFVPLDNSLSCTTTTDTKGYYSLSLKAGQYGYITGNRVTPPGWYSGLSGLSVVQMDTISHNLTNQDLITRQYPWCLICLHIIIDSSEGIIIHQSNAADKIINNPAYEFTVPQGWSGTITPTKPGYTFTPSSITLDPLLIIDTIAELKFTTGTHSTPPILAGLNSIAFFSIKKSTISINGKFYSIDIPLKEIENLSIYDIKGQCMAMFNKDNLISGVKIKTLQKAGLYLVKFNSKEAGNFYRKLVVY